MVMKIFTINRKSKKDDNDDYNQHHHVREESATEVRINFYLINDSLRIWVLLNFYVGKIVIQCKKCWDNVRWIHEEIQNLQIKDRNGMEYAEKKELWEGDDDDEIVMSTLTISLIESISL